VDEESKALVEEFRRLQREQADDASQRPLHEKGVRYRDETDRPLDAEPPQPSSAAVEYESFLKAARQRALA
jgi:hypothetical protein